MAERPTDELEVALDEAQVEFFRANGYLTIERITTDAEIDWLRGLYDQLFEQRAGEESGEYFDLGGRRGSEGREVLPQLLNPEARIPELAETVFARNARALGAQLLDVGSDELKQFGHMIFKPANYGRETPWHQDEAYWEPTMIHSGLSVWMPLDEATVESGCMQFVPGSHLERVREHHHVDHDPLVHALQTEDLPPERAVACPVPVGGATFHHCRMLHYAGPNTTPRPRRAYIQILNAPSIPNPRPDKRPWLQEELDALLAIGAPIPDM